MVVLITMGRVGFLFKIKDKDKVSYSVIFVETIKTATTTVIGFEEFLPKDAAFYYLSQDLNLSSIEMPPSRYGKISASETTIIDFKNLTIWVSSYTYTFLRELMEVEEPKHIIHELLLVNVSRLVEFLNL